MYNPYFHQLPQQQIIQVNGKASVDTIQLAPNGVDVSQSGSLMGTVRAVSQYPVGSTG